MYTSKVVCWRLTLRCNRACRFCLSRSGPRKIDPHFEAQDTLKRLSELGFLKISYTGGEPLLVEQLPEFVQIGDQLGLASVITTNGDLLQEDLPSWLNQLEHIKLSFYGDRSLHDSLMGAGHFDSQLTLANRLRSRTISVTANYMLGAPQVEQVQDFLTRIAGLGIHSVVLQTYIENRRPRADDTFKLPDVSQSIAAVTPQLQAFASLFPGGIRVHDFSKRDWLIVLDEQSRLTLPSNTQEPDHVLGNLFDDSLMSLSGQLDSATTVLADIWDVHHSGGAIRTFAPREQDVTR